MGDVIANDLKQFQGNIASFKASYDTLVKDFDEVNRLMQELNAMWTGQAHDELLLRFETDKRQVQEMINYMKDILSHLNYADEEYQHCERDVKNMIDSMKV